MHNIESQSPISNAHVASDKALPQIKKTELTGIQFLRGIAALMVVLTHAGGMAGFAKYFNLKNLGEILRGGSVGVELFFVISGFIIAYVSLEDNSLKPISNAKAFIKKRFIRIIPFMWICIIGYALLRVLGRDLDHFPTIDYLRAFFLYPIGQVQPNQIWTLRHEFLFYLVFSFTIMHTSQKWFFIFLWFLSPLLLYPFFDFPNSRSTAWVNFAFFLFSKLNLLFLLGFIIGLLFLKGKLRKKFTINGGFLICLLSCIPLFIEATYLKQNFEFEHPLIYILSISLPIAAIMLLSLRVNVKSTNPVDKLGLLLGNASYSIYLTHAAIISAIFGFWSKFQKSPNQILLLIVVTVIACTAGVIVHLYVEKPIIRYIQSKQKRKMKA